jgi:hypothetical protein
MPLVRQLTQGESHERCGGVPFQGPDSVSEWPLRRAYLSQEEKPTLFGVHPEIAKYYGVDPAAHESRATTLNYTAQH